MGNKGSIVQTISEIFPKTWSWERNETKLVLGKRTDATTDMSNIDTQISSAKDYAQINKNLMKGCRPDTKKGRKDFEEFEIDYAYNKNQVRILEEKKRSPHWWPFYKLGHPAKNTVVHVRRPLNSFDMDKLKRFLKGRDYQHHIHLSFENTKGQDPQILREIGSWKDSYGIPYVDCSVLGGMNYQKKAKYSREHFIKRASYDCENLADIIEKCQEMEGNINKGATDIQKAMFVYGALSRNLTLIEKDATNSSSRKGLNPLDGFITGKTTPMGASVMYKEMMDRLGIECEFQSNIRSREEQGREIIDGVDAWNIVTAGGQTFGVDLGADIRDKYRQEYSGDLQHFAVENSSEEFYAEHTVANADIYEKKNKKIKGIHPTVTRTAWEGVKSLVDLYYPPVVSRESDYLKNSKQDEPTNK